MSAIQPGGAPADTTYATDPFDAPVRGISFGGAFTRFFQKYARFSGRASLSEFWWMYLWAGIFGLVIGVVVVLAIVPSIAELATAGALNTETTDASAVAAVVIWGLIGRFAAIWIIVLVIELALLVPALALTVRRLHDTNQSGHLAWLLLIPSVGHLIVLILCLMPSQEWGRRFDRPIATA